MGVFGIILVFLFAGFSANIKEETSDNYHSSMVLATERYAANITASVNKTDSLGRTVAEIITREDMADKSVSGCLNTIVNNSDAYMAVLTDMNGNGMTQVGDKIDLSKQDYFGTVSNSAEMGYIFVPDDGIRHLPAFILSTPVSRNGQANLLLTFFSMDGGTLRNLVTPESEYNTKAYSALVDRFGTVLTSTLKNSESITGKNLWTDVLTQTNQTIIRRAENRVKAEASGSFDSVLAGVEYLTVYVPVSGTNVCLIVFYPGSAMDKAEASMYRQSISRLSWITIVVFLFLVLVTVLNIIQILVSQRNTEELKDKADTDLLTGLKNKLATEREIKEYIANYPDSLAMMFIIDIDNFKKINDTMGHAFGDEVLRELGKHIGINFRVSDVIGRTGGDEFMVFLKNLKEDANTLREAQKLIYFFRHFQVGDYVKYTVTASIGAAVFPAHGSDFESLYKAADAAVYKSKKRGKNQLSFFDDRDRTPEEVAEADSHLIDIERKDTPIES